MSSYLDLSVERNTKEGWKHIYSASYEEGMEIINCRVLRDFFAETEHYDAYAMAYSTNLTEETLLNLAMKIEEKGFLSPIREDSPYYPYKYRRVETLVGDCLSKDEIVAELEKMTHSIKTRFNHVIVLVKPENYDDVVKTNAMMSSVGLRCGMIFSQPYHAFNALTNDTKLEDKDWFDGIVYCDYVNDKTGESVNQYIMSQHSKISTYKNLLAMKEEVEKSIAKVKESMNDNVRLSKLLARETEGVTDDDWDTSLGHIIKDLIGNDSEFTDYTDEYLEGLETTKAELEKLILITGENGRVIWSIS